RLAAPSKVRCNKKETVPPESKSPRKDPWRGCVACRCGRAAGRRWRCRSLHQRSLVIAAQIFGGGRFENVFLTCASSAPGQGEIEVMAGGPRDWGGTKIGQLQFNKNAERIKTVADDEFVIVRVRRPGHFVGN